MAITDQTARAPSASRLPPPPPAGRRNRWLAPLAGVLVASGLVLALEWDRVAKWVRPPEPRLPAAGEIVELRATVWAAGSRGYYETGVPEFVVPPLYAERVWRRFDGAEYVRDPQVSKADPLGEVVATTRSGTEVRVTFYETGTEELVFTRNGEDFFRAAPKGKEGQPLGGGLALGGTLRHLQITSSRN